MQHKNFSWLLVALLVFLVGVPILNDTQLFPERLTRALIVSAHEKRIRKGKVLSQHTGLPPRADS